MGFNPISKARDQKIDKWDRTCKDVRYCYKSSMLQLLSVFPYLLTSCLFIYHCTPHCLVVQVFSALEKRESSSDSAVALCPVVGPEAITGMQYV